MMPKVCCVFSRNWCACVYIVIASFAHIPKERERNGTSLDQCTKKVSVCMHSKPKKQNKEKEMNGKKICSLSK
jgi:hypothetical protein